MKEADYFSAILYLLFFMVYKFHVFLHEVFRISSFEELKRNETLYTLASTGRE